MSYIYGFLIFSVSMAVVIGLTYLFSRFTSGKFSAVCRYAIWALVMIRMCIPVAFSFFPAVVSVKAPETVSYSVPAQTPRQENPAQEQSGDAGTPAAQGQVNNGSAYVPAENGQYSPAAPAVQPEPSKTADVPSQINGPKSATDPAPAVGPASAVEPDPASAVEPASVPAATPVVPAIVRDGAETAVPLTGDQVALILFGVYFGIGAFYFIYRVGAYAGTMHKLKYYLKTPDELTTEVYSAVCREMKIKRPPLLRIGGKRQSPMLCGFFRKYIVLPDASLSQSDLEGILRHELTHYKRGDVYMKFISMFAVSINYINPFVYLAASRMEKEMEFSCDELVLRGETTEKRRDYGNALLNVIKGCRADNSAFTTEFKPGKHDIKRRFMNIMDGGKKKKGVALIALALVVCMVGSSIVACTSDNNDPAETGADIPDEIRRMIEDPFTYEIGILNNHLAEGFNEGDPIDGVCVYNIVYGYILKYKDELEGVITDNDAPKTAGLANLTVTGDIVRRIGNALFGASFDPGNKCFADVYNKEEDSYKLTWIVDDQDEYKIRDICKLDIEDGFDRYYVNFESRYEVLTKPKRLTYTFVKSDEFGIQFERLCEAGEFRFADYDKLNEVSRDDCGILYEYKDYSDCFALEVLDRSGNVMDSFLEVFGMPERQFLNNSVSKLTVKLSDVQESGRIPHGVVRFYDHSHYRDDVISGLFEENDILYYTLNGENDSGQIFCRDLADSEHGARIAYSPIFRREVFTVGYIDDFSEVPYGKGDPFISFSTDGVTAVAEYRVDESDRVVKDTFALIYDSDIPGSAVGWVNTKKINGGADADAADKDFVDYLKGKLETDPVNDDRSIGKPLFREDAIYFAKEYLSEKYRYGNETYGEDLKFNMMYYETDAAYYPDPGMWFIDLALSGFAKADSYVNDTYFKTVRENGGTIPPERMGMLVTPDGVVRAMWTKEATDVTYIDRDQISPYSYPQNKFIGTEIEAAPSDLIKDLRNFEYYGEYNGAYAVHLDSMLPAEYTEVVCGYLFSYSDYAGITIIKDGKNHTLKDAYALGLVTEDDVGTIAYLRGAGKYLIYREESAYSDDKPSYGWDTAPVKDTPAPDEPSGSVSPYENSPTRKYFVVYRGDSMIATDDPPYFDFTKDTYMFPLIGTLNAVGVSTERTGTPSCIIVKDGKEYVLDLWDRSFRDVEGRNYVFPAPGHDLYVELGYEDMLIDQYSIFNVLRALGLNVVFDIHDAEGKMYISLREDPYAAHASAEPSKETDKTDPAPEPVPQVDTSAVNTSKPTENQFKDIISSYASFCVKAYDLKSALYEPYVYGIRYYGKCGDAIIARFDYGKNALFTDGTVALAEVNIEGYDFSYYLNPLCVFKSGNLYLLAEAYDAGLITKEEISEIHELFANDKYTEYVAVVSPDGSVSSPYGEYKMIFNGKEIKSDNPAYYDKEKNAVMMPFVTLLDALGFDPKWKNDNICEVVWGEDVYTLDLSNKTFTNQNGYSYFGPMAGDVMIVKAVKRELMVDSKNAGNAFMSFGMLVYAKVDYGTHTITVNASQVS